MRLDLEEIEFRCKLKNRVWKILKDCCVIWAGISVIYLLGVLVGLIF